MLSSPPWVSRWRSAAARADRVDLPVPRCRGSRRRSSSRSVTTGGAASSSVEASAARVPAGGSLSGCAGEREPEQRGEHQCAREESGVHRGSTLVVATGELGDPERHGRRSSRSLALGSCEDGAAAHRAGRPRSCRPPASAARDPSASLLELPEPYDFELSTERFRRFGTDLANLWHDGALHRVVGGREVRIAAAPGGVEVEPLDEETPAGGREAARARVRAASRSSPGRPASRCSPSSCRASRASGRRSRPTRSRASSPRSPPSRSRCLRRSRSATG